MAEQSSKPDYGEEWRPQTARRMKVYAYLAKRHSLALNRALAAGDVDQAKKSAEQAAHWAGWLCAADWGRE